MLLSKFVKIVFDKVAGIKIPLPSFLEIIVLFSTFGKAAYEQAKQNPAEEMHFRQFRLNEWCNADIRWMPMDK